MKKETIPVRVFNYLLNKKVAVKKTSICRDLELKMTSVNRACRILRKQKKIGMYMRKYWGVR